jgi:putative holliday junction resolvase
LNKFGRIIGIDVGTKRVGLARSDLLRTSANPAGTFSPDEAIAEISKLHQEQPILAFVIGWPLTTTGEASDATKMVDAYIKKLNRKFPEVPVYKIDERFSSKRAVKTLIDSGTPRKKRREKGRVDQAVAALILQEYLETQNDF